MAKEKIVYVCSSCGYDSPKWVGRCPSCGEWNTMKEFNQGTKAAASMAGGLDSRIKSVPVAMSKIPTDESPRINMGDGELIRVLGGGLVPGSMTLLGGEPGIGKSTLVLQTVLRLKGMRVLYVSGEESAQQLKLRADRILCGEMAGVDEVDAVRLGVQKIVIAQIRRHEGITAQSHGTAHELSAGRGEGGTSGPDP